MWNQPRFASPEQFQPRRAEWLALLGILAAMLAVNLGTYNLYPTVWADEVLWSEPAINLVKTGHFTTSVWELQPAGTFWAAQSPLYCFALAGWLPMAGTTLLAVRSFNYFLISAGVFLVWFASWRFRFIGRAGYRLLVAPLLLLGYGMSFSFRCSRPDILGMISLLLFGLAFSVRSPRPRPLALFLSAALAPWVGVQVALYVFLASVLAKALFREVKLADLALIWTGLGAGTVSLLLVFYINGVLPNFMGTLFQAANEQAHWARKASFLGSVPRRMMGALTGPVLDFSCLPLLLGLVVFWIWFRRRTGPANRRALAFLFALYVAIPLVFNFTGHFAFYYSYMIYVPLVLAFLHVFDRWSAMPAPGRDLAVQTVFTCALLGAMLVGLPLRLGLALKFFKVVPRTDYAKIIQAELRPDDVVFAHYTAFFEAKQVAQNVYGPMYGKTLVNLTPAAHEFTPEEKQSLTVLIIWQHQFDFLRGYLGGDWVAVSEPFGDSRLLGRSADIPLLGRRLQTHFEAPQLQRYKLQIFRRKPAVLAAQNQAGVAALPPYPRSVQHRPRPPKKQYPIS